MSTPKKTHTVREVATGATVATHPTGYTVTSETVPVAVAPTQVRRPWRSTLRTVFQLVVALATLLPFVASGVYDDPDTAPAAVVQVLAVAGAITRVMALPQVEAFLRRFAPWLAAAPDPARQ